MLYESFSHFCVFCVEGKLGNGVDMQIFTIK